MLYWDTKKFAGEALKLDYGVLVARMSRCVVGTASFALPNCQAMLFSEHALPFSLV